MITLHLNVFLDIHCWYGIAYYNLMMSKTGDKEVANKVVLQCFSAVVQKGTITKRLQYFSEPFALKTRKFFINTATDLGYKLLVFILTQI